ncbi:MAG: hypothetical protein Q9220_000868 [cf. Caloplaca sp. 1 TL-2023]
MTATDSTEPQGSNVQKHVPKPLDIADIWKDAPILKGTTKYDPLPDVGTIMITGGAGFIASWLVRHLVLTYPQYRVVCFDKLDYCATLNNHRILDVQPNFSFFQGDVASPADVTACLEQYKVDTIFHFAAQSHVDLSFGNSYGFTATNVYGTHVMLECAKAAQIRRFVHISTDEVYGEVDEDSEDLMEASILAPTNPYAASKAAAEMLVNAYWKSFKLPVMIARSNNVYGPHQYPEKVIPKFTCLLERGQKVVLHGDGKHTRRYLFAGDAADAFDTILHKGTIGQIYNIGSADEISNLTLCSKLLKEFGLSESDDWISHSQDRPFNDRRYAVNGQKLCDLGWQQKTPFNEGLKMTVDWYRKYGERWWGNIDDTLGTFPVIKSPPLVPEHKLRSTSTNLDSVLGNERKAMKGPEPTSANGVHKASHDMSSSVVANGDVGVQGKTIWFLAFFGPSIRGFIVTTFNLPTIKTDLHPSRSPFEDRKLAMLVEVNPFGHLTALLLHMIAVVPFEWRFVYMGSKESIALVEKSLPIKEYIKNKKLVLREVPAGFDASTNEGMHRMLTHMRFYEEVVDPAEWFLLFRSDTILCAQSNQTLNDWLEYDWVGAPWRLDDRFGGNGALSLRRVSGVKQVLRFQSRLNDSDPSDRWLCSRMGLLPDAKMAPAIKEAEFSVENVWHDKPMGYRADTTLPGSVWGEQSQRKQIYDYCPEVKIIHEMKLERQRCQT